MSRSERLWGYVFVGILVLLLALLIYVSFILLPPEDQRIASGRSPSIGERETMIARVVKVVEEGFSDQGTDAAYPYQRLLVYVERGSLAGQEIVVEEGTINVVTEEGMYHPGDRVYLERQVSADGDSFYISDLVRTPALYWIVGLFIASVLLVGWGKGLRSLLGTAFSLLVIFAFIAPQILAGRDPVLVSIAGSIALLAVSNYLIYGWNIKAHAAMAGMVLSLILTGTLAWLFLEWTRLTGLTAEESTFLMIEMGPGLKLKGLLLGGIIIGSLGVLDDICVGQASAVFELIQSNPDLGWKDLFRHSLNIGRDHIAAMTNTLLLAYAGASLPLLLLFVIYQEPLWLRINREPIAEEIVRTLAGSIGLVLAVPITSLIATLLAQRMARRKRPGGFSSTHAPF